MTDDTRYIASPEKYETMLGVGAIAGIIIPAIGAGVYVAKELGDENCKTQVTAVKKEIGLINYKQANGLIYEILPATTAISNHGHQMIKDSFQKVPLKDLKAQQLQVLNETQKYNYATDFGNCAAGIGVSVVSGIFLIGGMAKLAEMDFVDNIPDWLAKGETKLVNGVKNLFTKEPPKAGGFTL